MKVMATNIFLRASGRCSMQLWVLLVARCCAKLGKDSWIRCLMFVGFINFVPPVVYGSFALISYGTPSHKTAKAFDRGSPNNAVFVV